MKGSRLHLDLFRVFDELARTRSFSKAAARHHLTQSAVSQQVSFLERHLGRRLVERGKGKFFLTEAGESFREGCRGVLEAFQQAVDRIQRRPSELSGTVRLETVYSIGLHSLAPHVKSFMRSHPKVNLRVEYLRSDRIYTDVVQGACDLGIVAYPWNHPMVRVVPFKDEKMVLVTAPEDSLAGRRSVRLRDLRGRDFVAFEADIPTRQAVDEALRRRRVPVNIVHEFDNIETMKRSVEIGAGVSILPEDSVLREVRSRTLAALPIADVVFRRPTGIIIRKGRELSLAARAFVRLLTRTGKDAQSLSRRPVRRGRAASALRGRRPAAGAMRVG